MCGIAGFYGFRDDNLIKKFSQELEHRGPDGEGLLINDTVTLLSRRLAIIDRKGGDQPIFNEDKSIALVFVGEIYNYIEQREELIKLGHKFRTKSDTEVVVHAYEQWGTKSFDRHNGMFTIALYDQKQEKLILARDHFGIKPLYYTVLGGENLNSVDSVARETSLSSYAKASEGQAARASLLIEAESGVGSKRLIARDTYRIVFSSELKPIVNSGLIKKKPNDGIIYRYLKYRIHDDQRETFFAGVNRLMPGEMLVISNQKSVISKYTKLREELLNNKQIKKFGSKEIEIFKNKLNDAIRLRLISEVPVGTCLSGGLDSSTVVATVNKLLKEKVKEAESVGKIQNTFSAVFPESSNNEEEYINEIVESLKSKARFAKAPARRVQSHRIYPKPEEFFKEMEEFIRTQEEPTISTGPYAQYKVMQEAHKYVTVLLDGQGADEMMAGYVPYYIVYLRQLWKEKKYLKLIKEVINSLDILGVQSINRLYTILGIKKKLDVSIILNKDFTDKFSKERFKVENNNLKKRLIEDIFANSLQALLRYEDRNAMRFSIEGRVPFLDFNLLKYLFSLPVEAIIKNGWNKNILRESIRGLVPELIRKRRNKIGFTTPEYQWFMRMKNKIYSIFLSESFAKRKYFKQAEVLKAFQGFIEGKNEDTMVFWRLINIEIWLRVFFDQPSRKSIKSIKSIKSKNGANEGKKVEIRVDGKEYLRYLIRTEVFKRGDDYVKKITEFVSNYLVKDPNGVPKVNAGWFIVVSEKIVAISQGRSYFIWDIKTGFWAKLLSKFIKKTPYGIGLGSPWTMQLAINEVGLARTILAAAVGKMVQPFGIKGMFYRIAGNDVNAIDGPTEYSLYPSNVSAKLGPKWPEKVAKQIHEEIVKWLNSYIAKKNHLTMQLSNHFLGVVIIDANDLGQNVLGNSTGLDNKLIEKIFSDNPMGQSDEQTPLVLVFEK